MLDSHGDDCRLGLGRVMIELSPNFSQFHCSGRWTQTDSGSLIASWASASISFTLTSSSLSIRLGPQTTQKYISGGSSTALVCSISNPAGGHDRHDLSTPSSTQVLTFTDVEPGLLSLVDCLGDGQHKLVEITLVDWSYVLELASVVVDSLEAVQAPSHPSSHSRLLFIGDSISCGYSPEPMLVPRGSFDAFTSRTAAHLGLPYDIVAYPGITLVDPDPAGPSFVRREPGMVSRFFLASSSPFDVNPAQLNERPTIVTIALGTNDRGIGMRATSFVQTMRTFVTRLAEVYHETLTHICIIHFFPYIDVQAPSTIIDAFAQIAEQVAADHPSIGVHVWDLGIALDRQLTIDRVHPTVQGHIALSEALTGLLRPLVTGAHDAVV